MLCKNLKNQVRLLLRHIDTYVERNVNTALQITTSLKQLLASPAADILTAIIPGNIDDIIRRQLIYAIDKAIEVLAIAESCKQYTDINDKLRCFALHLQNKEPHLQDAILQKMASLMAGELDGQRLKQSIYDLCTQAKYTAAKTDN